MVQSLHWAAGPQVLLGLLCTLLRCAAYDVAGVQPALLAGGVLQDVERVKPMDRQEWLDEADHHPRMHAFVEGQWDGEGIL